MKSKTVLQYYSEVIFLFHSCLSGVYSRTFQKLVCDDVPRGVCHGVFWNLKNFSAFISNVTNTNRYNPISKGSLGSLIIFKNVNRS